jgi:hypothetical protein
MNKILSGILKVVEAGAVSVVPGAVVIDTAVHSVVDHKGSEQSIENAVLAGLQELETLKPETIADPATFNANIQIAHDAIIRAIAAVKTPSGSQTVPSNA